MGRGLSITAFVLAFIFPLIGLILGIIAINKAKNDSEGLKGLAIAAIIIGGFFTILILLIIVFGVFSFILGDVGGLGVRNDFSVEEPLIAGHVEFNSERNSITFSIGYLGEEKIRINKIQVDKCSNIPVEITFPLEILTSKGKYSISYPGIYYSSENDCIKPNEYFNSSLSFYYVEGNSSIERIAKGNIGGTPN